MSTIDHISLIDTPTITDNLIMIDISNMPISTRELDRFVTAAAELRAYRINCAFILVVLIIIIIFLIALKLVS